MAIPFKYNRRSLLIRRVSNSMTVGAIAIVVGVFVAAMAIVGGLDSAIKDSSSPDTMILIGRGADSEANSFITLDQLDALGKWWVFSRMVEVRSNRRFGPIYIACRRIPGEVRVTTASVSNLFRARMFTR